MGTCTASFEKGVIDMSATDELLKNNQPYAAGFDKGDVPLPPGRGVAVVACMDARLHVNMILGLEVGDAHVIRNAGGAITDDAIRSLLISQRLLGTREIILIHHTDCGMLTFTDDAVKAQVQADTGIRPAFALEAFPDLDEDVRQSIARIQASPLIPHRDSVRGFVYDVHTGELREVSPARDAQLAGAPVGAGAS
jgi:carbonic anhydrase